MTMDYLSKVQLTSDLTMLWCDLKDKQLQHSMKHPEADISSLKAKLDLLEDGIDQIHLLYKQRGVLMERQVKMENDLLNAYESMNL